MKLLVVILNYRVTGLTIDCLRSLSGEIGSMPDARVAVCENGTGGDAEQRLREAIDRNGWGGWVQLTVVHPNRGFTGGNNVVIREAMARPDPPRYFLLLNADTIVQPRALAALVEFMDRNPQAGIAASRLENPDGSEQGSAYRFYSIAGEFERAVGIAFVSRMLARRRVAFPMPKTACEVDWVPGCSMIIRREVIEAIGPLDEGFYTYFDDIDYCWNARRAGWRVWFVPESRVFHLEGASTGVTGAAVNRRPRYWFQARRRFWLKNYGPAQAALADAAFITGHALWRVRRFIQRKPAVDPPHLLADFIANSVFVTGFELRAAENPALKQVSPGGDTA
jgi:GT2 family glycosyltransferase